MTANRLLRTLLPVGLMILGVLLAGCDTFYEITLENGTDREVTVRLGYHEWRMRPCSVRVSGAVSGPPVSSGLVEFEVEDATGKSIQTIEVPPEQKRRSDEPRLYVRIADPDAAPCPLSAEDKYVLVVKSFLRTDVQLSVGGQLLGTISPLGEAEFGPLQGTLRDSDEIVARAPDGRECRPGWGTVDYGLGEVPRVSMGITEDSFR